MILRFADDSLQSAHNLRILIFFLLVAVLVPLVGLQLRKSKKGPLVPLPLTPPGNIITGNLHEVLAAVNKRQR